MNSEHDPTSLGSTPGPRLLVNTNQLPSDGVGAIWKHPDAQRGLDVNLIALAAGTGIPRHDGPALDVLVHVVAGTGSLLTQGADVDLEPGSLVWLPAGSRRGFRAGDNGLRYLTVHQRRHDALRLERRSGEGDG